jgi:hypothetical protein
MVVIMNNAARRSSLKTSVRDLPIPLFANDAEVQVERYCTLVSSPCNGNTHKVLLYNRGTANLTSAIINYNVNGGINTPINWSGTILPNRYEVVTFTTTQTNGTLNVSVGSTNGSSDQRVTNNTASRAFNFPATTPPTDYAFTNFTYNLIGDRYGNETTWSLVNASGTVLYSGGPYTNSGVNGTQPLVTNQAWNLPAGCYTYTINDSFGDGINSSPTNYGVGSWNIRTNSGATTVASGGTFTTSETASFTNASLSSISFEVLDNIKVYPNPTNNILNVSILNATELPKNYKVVNSLGQLVKTASVSMHNFNISSSDLSAGIYFLQLNFSNNTETIRFIKN